MIRSMLKGTDWKMTVLAVVLIALSLGGLARGWTQLWSWVPWSSQARLERAEADLRQTRLRLEAAEDTSVSHARARTAEAEARAAQQDVLEAAYRQGTAVARATQFALDDIRRPPDAVSSPNPVRLDRLRDHDRRLCEIAPDLDGCTAALADPGAGRTAMQPGDPAE